MNTEQNYVGRGNYANTPPPMAQIAAKTTSTADGRIEEIWKPIPSLGFPYQVSNHGRIRKAGTGHYYSIHRDRGVKYVRISVEGKLRCVSVHRAVAAAFVSNPKGYFHVRFIDGDRSNVAAFNLAWVKLFASHKDADVPTTKNVEPYEVSLTKRLVLSGQLSTEEAFKVTIIPAIEECMLPSIKPSSKLLVAPVAPINYPTLIGKVVAVVVRAKLFAYYLGRVVSIDEDFVRVSRDNSEWSERVESRSVIASIARVVSVLETSVN